MRKFLTQRHRLVLSNAEAGTEENILISASSFDKLRTNSAKSLILPIWTIILLLHWLAPHSAFAHSELIRSNPAPGETVGADLKGIHLEFSEPVGEESQILLFTSDFTPIPLTTYHETLSPNRINAPVSNLRSGKYLVQWTAVSPDGHQIEGSYQFRVINLSYIIHPTTLLLFFLLIVLIVIVFIWQRSHRNGRNFPIPPKSK